MNYCRFILICGFLCCVLLLSGVKPAFSAYVSTIDLIKMCNSEEEEQKKLCYGYIAGVIDYHNLTRSLNTAPTVNFCVPQHLSLGSVSAKVMEYLRTKPEHDQFIASPAVAMALFRYYPCKKRKIRKPARKRK